MGTVTMKRAGSRSAAWPAQEQRIGGRPAAAMKGGTASPDATIRYRPRLHPHSDALGQKRSGVPLRYLRGGYSVIIFGRSVSAGSEISS